MQSFLAWMLAVVSYVAYGTKEVLLTSFDSLHKSKLVSQNVSLLLQPKTAAVVEFKCVPNVVSFHIKNKLRITPASLLIAPTNFGYVHFSAIISTHYIRMSVNSKVHAQ